MFNQACIAKIYTAAPKWSVPGSLRVHGYCTVPLVVSWLPIIVRYRI
jgi:hypothetical protein